MKKILIAVIVCITVNCFSQITDSTYFRQYVIDRNYFLKLQETVESKNQYIGLQWCIDLLNKYIELEEKKFKEHSKIYEQK